MKKASFILITILISVCSFATEQFPDLLFIEEDTVYIKDFPLEQLMFEYKVTDMFDTESLSTGCWRGYRAHWRIENDSLFLEKIVGCFDENKSIDMFELFSKNQYEVEIYNGRIFADWYDISFTSWNYESQPSRNHTMLYSPTHLEIEEENVLLKIVKGIIKKDIL